MTQISKNLLEKHCPNYAYQLLLLEIELDKMENQQSSQEHMMGQIVKLIQLYMLAVELLQNENDQRYLYFNKKIQSLMMKRSIVEKLHKATVGKPPDKEVLENIYKMELENNKNSYQMKLYIEQGQLNMQRIRDFMQKETKQQKKLTHQIKRAIQNQETKLEERIKQRRLRSTSKSQGKKSSHNLINKSKEKIIIKSNYKNTRVDSSQEKEAKQNVKDSFGIIRRKKK